MKIRPRWVAPLVALVPLLSGVARPAHAEGRDLRGSLAPDIQTQSGMNGLSAGASLRAFRGRVVVLKFWFTGCGACRNSLPAFQSLYERYASRGVQFVADAYDDPTAVASFMRSSRYTFPVAVDPSGVGPSRYGVVSYPTNYVIGADGVVKAYNDLSPGVIERELSAAGPVAPASAKPASASPVVDEFAGLPPALAGAKAAAARNDYGEVLRIARAHVDPRQDAPAVVEAAKRLATLASQRFQGRVERIHARWGTGDYFGAYGEVQRLAADFHDTPKGEWALRWVVMLEGTPQVKARLVAGAPAPAR